VPELGDQRRDVGRVRRDVVAVVGRQRRVAEAAQIGRDHLEAGLGQGLDVAGPDALGLGPAVQQDERRAAAPCVLECEKGHRAADCTLAIDHGSL
jgi:hypothetical protein